MTGLLSAFQGDSLLDPWIQGGCRVQDVGFSVELKNLSFAYMDVARCGVPIRRPGKGREQDAVSFTHRLSEYFLNR